MRNGERELQFGAVAFGLVMRGERCGRRLWLMGKDAEKIVTAGKRDR